MHSIKEENYEYIRKRGKAYFGPMTCRDATYDCRVKRQYIWIIYETNKLRELFNGIHEKFLKAINHMEVHPTLGKEKKGTSFKLHKHNAENRDASMAHQMKYLSSDDIEMLRQGNEIIQKRYLSVNNTKYQTKKFGLVGDKVYKNYCDHIDWYENDARTTIFRCDEFAKNFNAIYKYMRVLSTRRVNPLIIPPDSLWFVLAQAKEDMKRNPQLTLPEDPNINIWNYYCFVTVVGSFQFKMFSVRQGTQHFTDENKASRKWSDSVHLITPNLIRTTPLLIEF